MSISIISQFGLPIGGVMSVSGSFSASGNGGAYNETGVVIGNNWKLCDGSLVSDADSPFDTRYVPELSDGRFIRGSSSGGILSEDNSPAGPTRTPSTHFAAAGNFTPSGTVGNHSHGSGGDSTLVTANHQHGVGSFSVSSHTHGFGHIHSGTLGDSSLSTTQDPDAPLGSFAHPIHGHPVTLNNNGGNTGVGSDTLGGSSGFTQPTITGTSGNTQPTYTGVVAARSDWFLGSAVNIEPTYLNLKFYMRIK